MQTKQKVVTGLVGVLVTTLALGCSAAVSEPTEGTSENAVAAGFTPIYRQQRKGGERNAKREFLYGTVPGEGAPDWQASAPGPSFGLYPSAVSAIGLRRMTRWVKEGDEAGTCYCDPMPGEQFDFLYKYKNGQYLMALFENPPPGWRAEGPVGYASTFPQPGLVALWEARNVLTGQQLLTTDRAEVDRYRADGDLGPYGNLWAERIYNGQPVPFAYVSPP